MILETALMCMAANIYHEAKNQPMAGQIAVAQTLDPGDLFFLSPTQSGQIVKTPPSTTGQYVTPIGEALATNELIIRIKRPIELG